MGYSGTVVGEGNVLGEGGAGSMDMIVAQMDVRGTVSAGVVASWYY